jgi:hypothetical protein
VLDGWCAQAKLPSSIAIEHLVPLSDAAMAVVEKMAEYRQGDHLFPGRRLGQSLNDRALRKLLGAVRAGVSVHGFRSSFRDWAAERTSFPAEIAEMARSHTASARRSSRPTAAATSSRNAGIWRRPGRDIPPSLAPMERRCLWARAERRADQPGRPGNLEGPPLPRMIRAAVSTNCVRPNRRP